MRPLGQMYIGSAISEATLKDSDLIDAFLTFLEAVSYETQTRSKYNRFLKRWNGLQRRYGWKGKEPDGGEDTGWLLSDLFDTLENIAPDGSYFGALEGDGACFGFWEMEGGEE